MSITAAMPTAKKRPHRTRTKRVSNLPPIKLSRLLPSHIDLRDPLKAVLVCEDCGTWVPITGMQSKVQKLVPHHTGKAGAAAAIHCRSSNRRIEFDMTIPEWRQALIDAGKDASSRQATTVLSKAFSPQTDRTLRARAERTPAGRVADWTAVLPRVADADKNRRAVPAGDAPTEGPAVPLAPKNQAAHTQRQAELGARRAAWQKQVRDFQTRYTIDREAAAHLVGISARAAARHFDPEQAEAELQWEVGQALAEKKEWAVRFAAELATVTMPLSR
ncbi:hypothetical protein ACIBL6_47720 [Streptomyces sp. NPDC050400]|uniref:hypothetical protein n=1 Tax=Streptomyces sp. NPDC050400 TaxID=3365610 RepID=UPI003798CA29